MVIVNTEPRVHNLGDHVILKPGVNANVDEDAWAKATEIATVRALIDEGVLRVEKRSLANLAKLKPAEALTIVRATFDTELLTKWAETEKRRQVADSIAAQLEALALKKAEKAEGEKSDRPSSEDEG